mmetsp:Transcript_10000/g.39028  ORF Transcript_10000/g.39028 Transcript_10000/m.39028 type:complete len:245 (-) Transcript_10000:49-783(-)
MRAAPAEPPAGLLRRDRLLVFAARVGGAFLLHQRPHLLLQRRVLSLGGDEVLLQSLGHGVELRRARLGSLPRLPRVRRRPRQVHRLPPPVLHELPPVVAYVVEGVAHSLRDCARVRGGRSPQVVHHAVKGEEVEVALGVEEEGRAPGLVFGVRSLGARVRDDFLDPDRGALGPISSVYDGPIGALDGSERVVHHLRRLHLLLEELVEVAEGILAFAQQRVRCRGRQAALAGREHRDRGASAMFR